MIESGAGTPDLSQIVALATLAVMTKTAHSLSNSPKVKTSSPVAPKEQAELLKEFAQLPAPLQKGCLKYAKEMAESYSKKTSSKYREVKTKLAK